jgi:HAE1 family hydrophobic/amphiphilic exporter-1
MVPLKTLITSTVIEQAALISHYNIFQSIEMNGDPAPGYSSGQAIAALREVADRSLPAGYGYEFSGLESGRGEAG